MGRQERAVTADDGPLQRFAHDLQVLRRSAGEPTYRAMGRRVAVSYSRLSEATKGRQLPTLATTMAFVTACGGDEQARAVWRERWETVRADQHSSRQTLDRSATHYPAGVITEPVPRPVAEDHSRPPDESRGLSSRRRHPAVTPLAAATAAAAVTAAIAGAINAHHPSQPHPTAPHITRRDLTDGQDPYVAGCGRDQQPLERQLIYRADGRAYGWVVVFYSAACAAAWGYVLGPNSPHWRVFITAHRLDDNTRAVSSFQGDARPNSWGNALSVRTGCVRAEAWIDNGPHALTSCWRPAGTLSHSG